MTRKALISCLLLINTNLQAQTDTLTKWDFVLPEVEVKSQKIYSSGDTINYNVASFMSSNDQNIGEVLKKLPGVSVSELGQISYKGLPIKKFYIEGLDLLKGRYGIATNNIDPRQIATIQVLENHQDIKALKELQPEEKASINLKLRNGVKGVFNLIATLGVGTDDHALWNNGLIASYFRRKSQFFATYKGNNTGEDLARELRSFETDNYSHTAALTTVSLPHPPNISKDKYYFNSSHAATYNNAYRLSQNGELGINAAYLNDQDERNSSIRSSHLLPSGLYNQTSEHNKGLIKSQMAYGGLQYQLNTDKNYLKEQLSFQYDDNRSHSQIEAGKRIFEHGQMESYQLVNRLHLTQRTDKDGGFELVSTTNIEKRPHQFGVSPNLFQEIAQIDTINQDVKRNNISTNNYARILSAIVMGRVKIHPTLLFNYQHDELKSKLARYENNLTLDRMDAGLALSAYAKFSKLSVDLSLPFAYRYFELKRVNVEKILEFEPYAKVSYHIDNSNELRLSTGISNATPNIEQLYSQYILTSYRQLTAYFTQELYSSQLHYASLSYDLKDILSMRFVGIDFRYNHHRPKVIYGYHYNGLCEQIISVPTNESSEMFSINLRGSQGLLWKRMKLGLECTYTYSDSPLLVQEQIMRYYSHSMSTNANVSLAPFRWLDFRYEGKFAQFRTNGMPTVSSFTQQCRADFMLPYDITLSSTLYHYYNNQNNNSKPYLLGDAEVNYTYKHIHFSLLVNNVFNRRQYLVSSLADLSSYVSSYNIRPRSILLKVRFKLL